MNPDNNNEAVAWGKRATASARRGDWQMAARQFLHVTELAPDDPRGWEGLARAHLALQDLETCQRLVETMQTRFPDLAYPRLLEAHLCKAHGDTGAAIAAYREALRREPARGEALFGLIDLQVPDSNDPVAQQALTTASDSGAPVADRINAGFAAGRILDRNGEYEAAFRQFAQANELARSDLSRQGIRYEPGRREQEIDARIARFPSSSFRDTLSPLPIDLTPIFVVGMPRSGTTLIEQILASHPEVEAAGELTTAHECEARYLAARDEAGLQGPVDPGNPRETTLLEDAREQYIEALFERDLDARWIVDKMPANFELAGFLRLLFPEAPIVHSMRDPRATCWSLYSANFGGHEPYYHNLEHLAHYYRQYQRIMTHWQEVLPAPQIDVQYEALVSQPDEEIPALLESVGLSPHEQCLAFHRTQRPVLTASHAQVRQPVYRSAIDHWQHYEPWLGPVLSLSNGDSISTSG